jgi:hypothetical protein
MTPEPADPVTVQASPQVSGPTPASDFPRERRFIFVQLLFSLTAAEIGREVADLVLRGPPFGEALAAYAHLFLATAVVITSWVGWTVSAASLRLKVNLVFSWEFVVLLIDVVLVILYFLLVRGAEIPRPGEPVVPSSWNEATAVACIFFFYFVWDVLTKAVIPGDQQGVRTPFFRRLVSGPMAKRGWISFVCMVFGILAWIFLHSASSKVGVLLVDASLLCLVLLFRAMKERLRTLSIVLGVAALITGLAANFMA